MFRQQIDCSYWIQHFLDCCFWDSSLCFGFWIVPESYLAFVNSRYSILWSLEAILLFASLAVLGSFQWCYLYYCLYHHQLSFLSNLNLLKVLKQVYFFSSLSLALLNFWFYQAVKLFPMGSMDFLDLWYPHVECSSCLYHFVIWIYVWRQILDNYSHLHQELFVCIRLGYFYSKMFANHL